MNGTRSTEEVEAIYRRHIKMVYQICLMLMDYFGIGQEDMALAADGVVQADKGHTYENGWTVEVKQLLFDRYCGEILVDLTAPDGTELTEQDYRMDFHVLPAGRDMSGQGWGDSIGGSTCRRAATWPMAASPCCCTSTLG